MRAAQAVHACECDHRADRFSGWRDEAVRGYLHAKSAGMEPDVIALASKVTLAALMLIYVMLCVRSFIAARRSREV